MKRIALTEGDVTHGNLPSFPAKRTDTRYPWFLSNYGRRCWELDAMPPNALRGRVMAEVLKFVNQADWEKHKQVEEAERETTRKIAQRLSKRALSGETVLEDDGEDFDF